VGYGGSWEGVWLGRYRCWLSFSLFFLFVFLFFFVFPKHFPKKEIIQNKKKESSKPHNT